MKKLYIFLLVCICLCFGIEYSCRMKALGTDFAYLIPDYETDTYLNPNLLGEKLTGVSYEPDLSSPLTLRVLSRRFGWCGQYWGSYRNNKLIGSIPNNITSVYLKDFWMLDMRDRLPKFLASDVWNLYNDGGYYERRFFGSEDWYDTTRIIKYLISANDSYRVGEHWIVVDKICGGPYHYYKNANDYGGVQTADQWLMIYSGRIGLFYRDTVISNKFTSGYIEVGGPVSTEDIDRLPYSVFSHVSEVGDFQHTFFARAFISELGFAKSFPVDVYGFVVVGFYDVFLFQQTEQADTNITSRAINNRFSFPVAVEWASGRLSLRFGTKLSYTLNNGREWDVDSTLVSINEHTLSLAYSFGLAWCPIDHLVIDLYNINDLMSLNDWAIYLKYNP